MNQPLRIFLAIAIVVVAIFFVDLRTKPQPLLGLGTPQTAAAPADAGLDFTARRLNGGKISLSQFRGHPIIVDFWATWCPPCRRQIPELNALYKKYNKSKGLVVIGVSCDTIQGDSEDAIKPFVEELKIAYPIAIADEALVDRLGVEAIPTTLFVGPDGEIVSRMIGAGHRGELSESTRRLLAGGHGGKPAAPSPAEGGHVVDL